MRFPPATAMKSRHESCESGPPGWRKLRTWTLRPKPSSNSKPWQETAAARSSSFAITAQPERFWWLRESSRKRFLTCRRCCRSAIHASFVEGLQQHWRCRRCPDVASKLAALNLPTVEQALVVPQFRVSLVSQAGQP